jgi:hypothetical protein
MAFTLATVHQTGGGNNAHTVTANTKAVSLIVAIIAIVPPILTAVLDLPFKSAARDQQRAELVMKQHSAQIEWLHSALALPSAAERKDAVLFLLDGKLIDDPGGSLRGAVNRSDPPLIKSSAPAAAKTDAGSPSSK